jgi:hypothetical protein
MDDSTTLSVVQSSLDAPWRGAQYPSVLCEILSQCRMR